VATEMALNVLAYNMKRVMAIIGVAGLLEALATWPGICAFKWTPTDANRERHARPEWLPGRMCSTGQAAGGAVLCAMLIRVFYTAWAHRVVSLLCNNISAIGGTADSDKPSARRVYVFTA
jgi:hypothetical protein